MTCCFLGHDDTDTGLIKRLEDTIEELIKEKEVDTFFVGNCGEFEKSVYQVLLNFRKRYKHINCYMVLSAEGEEGDCEKIIYPDKIDSVPKRFKLSHRNRWMVLKSDYMVARITHAWGDAPKFAEFAKRRFTNVIYID